jgi:N-acetylglucosamine-6-phosphate deacetylase
MTRLLIHGADIVTATTILKRHSLLCADGKIERIIPENQAGELQAEEWVDAAGNYLVPGFIDLHIHGACNFWVDTGPAAVEALSRLLPQYGVTGFLPTLCPRTSKQDDLALLASLAKLDSSGAAFLGFFLEGHFLALNGAIPAVVKNNDGKARVEALLNAASPYRIVFAVSPELDGMPELIATMTGKRALAFITHTAANAEQTLKAIAAGAVHATHFYNVFPYPGDPEPGVRGCGTIEAVYASPQVSVDFILDGEHVAPIAVKMALACKGGDRVSLITDANMCAGLPPGKYQAMFGRETEVRYGGGPARGIDPPGLVGSGLTMDRVLRNALKFLDVDLPQAVKMVSANPARVLGLEHVKGRIEAGYDADLAMLDQNLQVQNCWVGGRNVFQGKMERGCA